MTILNKKESITLFLGDILAFVMALWVALYLRSGEIPSVILLESFALPFGILFVVWVLVFFIAGLYEKQTSILRKRLPAIILNAQISNMIIAFLFFYLVPIFGIAPKTTLLIYLIVSFWFVVLWRLYGVDFVAKPKKNAALLIGSGSEMKELFDEVNKNNRYNLNFISSVDLNLLDNEGLEEGIIHRVYGGEISTIVIDLNHRKVEPILSHFYNLLFSRVTFIDMNKMYEDVFDRVPLSLVSDSWFIENVSTSPKVMYDTLKRVMDMVVAMVLGVISLVIYPLVWLLIKLDDGGSLFIIQDRIGRDNKKIRIYKFRSMSFNDTSLGSTDNKVTRGGGFIRKTRIDELPQLWNVIKGDLSLIGPRPELPSGVKLYEDQIPYYGIRHLIKPGLSGWAQMYHENHPHHTAAVEQTKEKLSYDLYYLKNRSFMLDIKIALRTIAQLLSRKGK